MWVWGHSFPRLKILKLVLHACLKMHLTSFCEIPMKTINWHYTNVSAGHVLVNPFRFPSSVPAAIKEVLEDSKYL